MFEVLLQQIPAEKMRTITINNTATKQGTVFFKHVGVLFFYDYKIETINLDSALKCINSLF